MGTRQQPQGIGKPHFFHVYGTCKPGMHGMEYLGHLTTMEEVERHLSLVQKRSPYMNFVVVYCAIQPGVCMLIEGQRRDATLEG